MSVHQYEQLEKNVYNHGHRAALGKSDGNSRPGIAMLGINNIIAEYAKNIVAEYGMEYSTADSYLLDERGEEFVVGDFFENGKSYPGGTVKPIVIENPETGHHDLLLAGGTKSYAMHYLAFVGMEGRKPVFRSGGFSKTYCSPLMTT